MTCQQIQEAARAAFLLTTQTLIPQPKVPMCPGTKGGTLRRDLRGSFGGV